MLVLLGKQDGHSSSEVRTEIKKQFRERRKKSCLVDQLHSLVKPVVDLVVVCRYFYLLFHVGEGPNTVRRACSCEKGACEKARKYAKKKLSSLPIGRW